MLSKLTRALVLCAAIVTASAAALSQGPTPPMQSPAGEIRGHLVETASGAPIGAGSIAGILLVAAAGDVDTVVCGGRLVVQGGRHVLLGAHGGPNVPERLAHAVARAWDEH